MIASILSPSTADVSWSWPLAWLLFVACFGLAWRPWAGGKPAGRRGDVLFVGALLACVAAFRWPILSVPYELHPDESQMISGAMTLRHDPVFWRAIDGNTSGPLNHYALILPTMLAGDRPYLGARITALLLASLVVGLSFVAARLVFPERVARIGVLPLWAFFAFAHHPEHVHYSSEHVPIGLMAMATFCVVRFATKGRRRWLFLAGVILALTPLAKLQAAPIAAAFFICAAGIVLVSTLPEKEKRMALGALLAGGLLVAVALAGYATAFGLWWDMKKSYFDSNVTWLHAAHTTQWRTALMLFGHVFHDDCARCLLVALVIPAGLMVLLRGRALPAPKWFGVLGAAGVTAAILSIAITGNGSQKYFLLVTPGLGLLGPYAVASMNGLQGAWARPAWIVGWAFFLGLGLGFPIADRIATDAGHGHYPDYLTPKEAPTVAIVEELHRWLRPNDTLAIWGGPPEFYVRAFCWQATRDGETSREAFPNRERDYFRARYMHDIEASRPRVFIDASGAYRRGFELDKFPQLAAYVQQHYELEKEIAARKIYVRRD